MLLLMSACGTPRPPMETATPQAPVTPKATHAGAATIPAPAATPTSAATPAPVTPPPNFSQMPPLQLWHAQPPEWFAAALQDFNRSNEWNIRLEARAFSDENALLTALAAAETPPDLLLAYPDQFTVSAQPILLNPQGLFYNATRAAELGFAGAPTTVQEFVNQICAANLAFRNDSTPINDSEGGYLADTHPAAFAAWLMTFSGSLTAGESYLLNTDGTAEAVTFLKTLYDRRCIWQSAEPYPDELFASRRALIVGGSLLDLPYQAEAMRLADSSDEWLLLPYPARRGDPLLLALPLAAGVLTVEPEQQHAAELVINWLRTPETQAALVQHSGLLPAQAAALPLLETYAAAHPQWGQAAQALPYLQTQPAIASWGRVQWLLHDVATQTYRTYFTIERIPDMLKELQSTAEEFSRNP
ncbi:MAG: hypothetical protein OHK0052_23920 [Anaerolineales bacterium]